MRQRVLPLATAALTACALSCESEKNPDPMPAAASSELVVAPVPAEVRARAVAAGLASLAAVVPPAEPVGFRRFVQDKNAAKVLGKALFWDQQVGSDGQACASCHFHAGADNRAKNQLNPGFQNRTAQFPNGDFIFGNTGLAGVPSPARFGPNYLLVLNDFPLHKLADPANAASVVLSDTNDVVSSQGVFNALFQQPAVPFDVGALDPTGFGAVFNVHGTAVRNVEPRNTPTMINAVFNMRNFWDGRARQEFNGVNPIGILDPTARIVSVAAGVATFVPMSLQFLSLASQADGPPLSNLEMSFAQRRFADLGRKMLSPITLPLALQRVHVRDSVLGPFSRQIQTPGLTGVSFKYADMVKKAFPANLWDGAGWVVDVNGAQPALVKAASPGRGQYTVMEWNFSVFFGLAVDLYEEILVADETPFDQFMEGDDAALTPQQLAGLDIFDGKGRCFACHEGAELTGASIVNVAMAPIERMVMGNGRLGVYDNGFYNIGVRPTREDLGLGNTIGPNNLPLSDARRFQQCVRQKMAAGQTVNQANGTCNVPSVPARAEDALLFQRQAAALLPPNPAVSALFAQADAAIAALPLPLFADAFAALVQAQALLTAAAPAGSPAAALLADAALLLPDPVNPGPDPARPFAPPLQPNERTVADGMFKTPGLRNVELTAPYFHNGGQATLEQVVQFYNRGGDFAAANAADFDAVIAPLGLTAEEQANLVAFLKALTDDGVRFERAPFDHPSIDVPNGGTPGILSAAFFSVGVLDDRFLVPEVGQAGRGRAIPLGTAGTVFGNFLDPLQ